MQSDPTITFRNIDSSPAVEQKIMERVVDLEKFHPRITSCDVVIEMPQKRKVSGREFEVHINLTVPGPDIHVSRSVGHSEASENLDLAINEAFAATRRLLQDQDREMDPHRVKRHAPIEHGDIARLFEGEGYGFIKSEDDGAEYYFSRESLTVECWDQLRVGERLKFRAEDGENGPYASNVAPAHSKDH